MPIYSAMKRARRRAPDHSDIAKLHRTLGSHVAKPNFSFTLARIACDRYHLATH
jgi:hypothetical protein